MTPEEIDNMVSDLLDSVELAIQNSITIPLNRDYYVLHYGEN